MGHRSNDLGGYHLVWTRDAVEAGLGLLAAGKAHATRMLSYLVASQEPDGRWPQNQFSFGRPYWTGVQLDQVGFPVIFAAKLLELGIVERSLAVERMVRSAASFLSRHGPLSPQDRWEENAGVSPFTLGVEVAALVAAAEFVDADEDAYPLVAGRLLERTHRGLDVRRARAAQRRGRRRLLRGSRRRGARGGRRAG